MRQKYRGVIVGVFALVTSAEHSAAQSAALAVEGAAGKAWFADDSAIEHTTMAVAARWAMTPRLTIGPEISYMIGPRSDRDLIVTGNVTFDVRPTGVTPFIVGGGGLFRHSNRFGRETFSSTEGAFTAGGGVRIPLGARVYIAPEARLGWELHTRFQLTIGYKP